jgi:LPXTG-motif cell wall-anchored protein
MVLSMRRSRTLGLGSLGLGVVGMLAVAAPAGAATTHQNLEVIVVHTTNENFSLGEYPGWAPEGPATFPSAVAANQDTSYVVQSYQPNFSKVTQGCSIKILSFSVEIEALQTLQNQGAQFGFFVGTPAVAVEGTTHAFDGTGIVDPEGGVFSLYPDQMGDLDGTLTLTLPSPIPGYAVPFGWVGLVLDGPARGPLWQINSASYQAEVTCLELEQEQQEQGQGQERLLPATGPASTALIGSAGFALAGVGVLLVARPRRRPAP